jgi:hypothetical protein
VAARADRRTRRRSAAHLGHRGLSAAQPAAARHIDHHPSAGHGVPASVPHRSEIAGFEGDTPDRRALAQTQQQQQQNVGTPTLGRRGYEKGLLTFVWRAEDENRDQLSYDVLYRREGDTMWKPLKRGLSDPILVWDTSSVPNGRYLVRVVASDAPVQLAGDCACRGRWRATRSISTTRRR